MLQSFGRRAIRIARSIAGLGPRHDLDLRRSILYRPLAILLALLLLPDLSWIANIWQRGAGGPFQAAAQIQICSTSGDTGTSSTQIVNVCRYANDASAPADWIKFQNDMIATYLTLHDLPAEDASIIYTYGRTDLRTEIRGLMEARLMNIIKTPQASRTASDQSIYLSFQKTLQPFEIQYLTATIAEWNRWRNDPCHFTVDPDVAAANNLTYDGTQYCFPSISDLFGGAIAPGAQYFEAVGSKQSYGQLLKNQTPISASTLYNVHLAIAFGSAVGAGIGAGLLVFSLASVLSFAVGVAAAVAAGTSTFAASAVAAEVAAAPLLAGVFSLTGAAFVFLAVIIGVLEGFQVFDNQAQVDQLNALSGTLTAWQTAPQDLSPFLDSASGTYKVNAVFTHLTTPEVASTTALPAHRPGTDQVFVITPSGQTTGQPSEQMTYKDWLGVGWTASTYGGWFVQSATTPDGVFHDSITPTIYYLDWSGTKYAASRKGFKFIVSKSAPASTDTACPADPITGVTTTVTATCSSYVASSIQLKNGSGNNVTVLVGQAPSFTSSPSANFIVGSANTFPITASGNPASSITMVGTLPNNISFTAGNPATLSGTAAAGTEGVYPLTLTARSVAGTVNQSFTLKVGTTVAFTSASSAVFTAGQFGSFSVTTTGKPAPALTMGIVLPQGLNFQDNGDGTATISGTPSVPGRTAISLCNLPPGCGIQATNVVGSAFQPFAVTVNPAPLTIASAPSGLSFTLSAPAGQTCPIAGTNTTPVPLYLYAFEQCLLTFDSPISGGTGTRYVFKAWNALAGNPRTITSPSSATTTTASFQTQYYLTTGATNGGTISPASGWMEPLIGSSLASIAVTATPNLGYAFTSFTGDLSGTTNPQNISMSGPRSVTANFGLVTATSTQSLPAQYSDAVNLRATISALTSGVSGLLQFSVNGANAGAPVTVNGAGDYTAPFTVTQGQGTYTIGAVFTGSVGVLGSRDSKTLTVSRENAIVTPSANNPMAVQVSAPGGTGSFQLTAAIQETADGTLGDISKATPVTFNLNPLVAAPQISCPVTTSVAGGVLTAVASCASVPVNVYDVTVSIGGNYYTGSAESVVAVYDPSLGAVSGAGTFLHNSVPATFGVNSKYNKSGQPQGAVLYLEHGPAGDVSLKSNALQSMSIVGGTAVILGKATVNGVGNYAFKATAIGNGQSPSDNLFGLQVTDPNGQLVPALSFSPINLKGGSIQVPK